MGPCCEQTHAAFEVGLSLDQGQGVYSGWSDVDGSSQLRLCHTCIIDVMSLNVLNFKPITYYRVQNHYKGGLQQKHWSWFVLWMINHLNEVLVSIAGSLIYHYRHFFKLRPSSYMTGSVRLPVCPSHLFHHVPIFISSWNIQELLPWPQVMSMKKVKVRGQRWRSQRSTPNLAVSGL